MASDFYFATFDKAWEQFGNQKVLPCQRSKGHRNNHCFNQCQRNDWSVQLLSQIYYSQISWIFLLFVLGQSVIYEAVRLIAAWGISELVDPAVARIQKMVSNNSDNNNVRYTSLCCIEKLLQTCSHLPNQRRAQGYFFLS